MNNRVTLLPVLLVWASFSIVCCRQSQVSAVLKDIQTYIDEKPDSALAVLEGIDSSALTSDRLKAEYAMLHTMALDKNYAVIMDEDEFLPASEYYLKHGNNDYKQKIHYYTGVYAYNKGEFGRALVEMTAAEALIPYSNDKRYDGLIYSSMSDIYNKLYNPEQELLYIKLADKYFSENNFSEYHITSQWRIAQALTNGRKHQEAVPILQELISNPEVDEQTARLAKEDYALICASRHPQNLPLAFELFNEVISDGQGLRTSYNWAAYAYVLKACGKDEESENLFSQLYATVGNDCGSTAYDSWKALSYEHEGDYVNAYKWMKNSLTHQDSLLKVSLTQSATFSQNAYFKALNRDLTTQAKTRQIVMIVLCFAALLIIIIILLTFRFRIERLKTEISRYESASLAIKRHIAEMETEQDKIHKLRNEYIAMYQSHFKEIGILCENVVNADNPEAIYRKTCEKLNSLVQSITGDTKGQMRFEERLNKTMGNVMLNFRQDFPKYSENDYRFVCCTFAGFDACTLSVIFKIKSTQAVHSKKYRIKHNIEASQSPHKDEYLSLL